ncbi:transposase [Neorhizobium sp. DT-125]|uniref:transposase n=1 Tax=Neorhizobium sp. DT-125 TaxID=3396163 RepID=UPI003F1BF057
MTVCAVARSHGLTPQQLFTWRRLTRKPLEVVPDVEDVRCMRQRSWPCLRSRYASQIAIGSRSCFLG